MTTNEMVTTYLETRYVDRAKLNELLQALFRQSYKVAVSAALQAVTQVWLLIPPRSPVIQSRSRHPES
jgi:hypothetical protein